MMEKQKIVLKTLEEAGSQMEKLWKESFDNFTSVGVSKDEFLSRHNFVGGVRNNLDNFSALSFVPRQLRGLPTEALERINEQEWQRNQQDPAHHRGFKNFFPSERTPTSMDMARLGLALLAETNLLRLTNVSLSLDRYLGPSEDAVMVAEKIVATAPPPGHSTEWAKRLAQLLQVRTEEDLRNDPNFSIFVAAVRNFLDNYE